MVAVAKSGIHFSNPREFVPYVADVTALTTQPGSGAVLANTTAFFTEMARRGIQDQTNWTANTYKTLLSVSGSGLMMAYIGCTAGGAETHTLEITVDGQVYTMTNASLTSGMRSLVTASQAMQGGAGMENSGNEALAAGKDVFTGMAGSAYYMLAWYGALQLATPMLKFERSLQIRAKHSATITNSTATAYSAVLYRKFLTA